MGRKQKIRKLKKLLELRENEETFEEEIHEEQTVLVIDAVKGEVREEKRAPTTLKKSDFKSKMYKYYKNLIGGNK